MAFRHIYSIKLLRISLGVFFIVLGYYGILQNVNEGIFGLNNPSRSNNQTIEIIFGIVELICGILILSGLVTVRSKSTVYMGSMLVLLFWLARIALTSFIWGIVINEHGVLFRPDIYSWILTFVTNLVIASGLVTLTNVYE